MKVLTAKCNQPNTDRLNYSNMTANEAYRLDMSWREAAGETEKKSFKDWIAEQKDKGNVDKAGALIYDRIFGSKGDSNSISTNSYNEEKQDSYLPKDDAPKSTKILGMPKGIAIAVGLAVVTLIGFGIYSMIKAKKNK